MAHFAELDSDNTVLRVVVVSNADCLDSDGNECENAGIQFCQQHFGELTAWKQTSYNSKIRKNYAGIGYKYDARRDAFMPPQPFPSWTLDENTCTWKPPIPMPSNGRLYGWNEEQGNWVELPNSTSDA